MNRKLPIILLFALFLISAIDARALCKAVPGSDQLWAKADIKWIWIGEIHGTTEIPQVFGDLVCNALAHGRRVTVALERTNEEQDAITTLIRSKDKDKTAAVNNLLTQPDWSSFFDGRTSQAWLDLLLTLRDLKMQYPDLNVSTMIDSAAAATSPKVHDEAMGKKVLSLAGNSKDELVFVLTGNVHGFKSEFRGITPAATYLPEKQLISLLVTFTGGHAWNINQKGCGSTSINVPPNSNSTRPFGVYLDPSLVRTASLDGILSLGGEITASTPANSTALASAPCRKLYLGQ